MDAVELARRAAADLHANAVAQGKDPYRPFEFAVWEAQRRGLDVEATSPGAAVLCGGRATLVPRDALILHENVGTPFEQAFLVAHEIGHVELGDDANEEEPAAIDPARPSETPPVGLDRVVDHGRRQRREVQMDLFAREFLMPRALVRRLHLEESETASTIAARWGAPFDVVAQQLLDALLLPPVEEDAPKRHEERPLNPAQKRAALHRGAAYLLEAGPGTGKTHTLASRVESLLTDSDIDPRRILLLTFSNKASGEMFERIARTQKEAAAAMWVGTFHAFGLDLLRRFHAEAGLPADPRMLDKTEAVELLEGEFPRLRLSHYRDLYDPTQVIADMLAAISRAKDEVVDAPGYAELAAAMARNAQTADAREAAGKAAEVARVYEAYERLKREAKCVDFGDLVALPVRLLEDQPTIRAQLQGRYEHVLVDEYQDVNRSSVRLLEALRPNGENLWVVGDPRQSIYRFRGASSFNMTRFGDTDFPGGVRGRLEINYRSTKEVVDAFSAFASGMKTGQGESGLEAHRGLGGHPPEMRTSGTRDESTVVLAETIQSMREDGAPYRDQAVLCTGNEKLSTIAQDLERLGVPVLFLGSLFERSEIKDLLSLLSLFIDRQAMGLTRIARWRDFEMTLGDVAAVLDHLRGGEDPPLAWQAKLESIEGLSTEGRAALDRLGGALAEFALTSSPWTVLATILLDRTAIAARLARGVTARERTQAIATWQFMNFLRVQPTGQGLPIRRLLDRVRRLVRLGDDRDLRQLPAAAQGVDAVRLMTIHGAKGLEFPLVHVPGMNKGTLPRTPPPPPCLPPDGMIGGGEGSALELFNDGQAEEQECLFYVAISRARDRIVFYAPTRDARGAIRRPSPFLDRLGPGLVTRDVRPDRTLPASPDDDPVRLEVDGGLTFAAPQIALYESCPRRFFYTHILEVGGRRTPTPFLHMHEAVLGVVHTIIGGEDLSDEARLRTALADAFAAHGLADYGYRAEFEDLALAMVRYFLRTRQALTPEPPTALRLDFGDEAILVRADDVLIRPDGSRTLRRIRTGHVRKADADDVGAAAFVLAARQAFPDAAAELVYLSDETTEPMLLSPKQLTTRRGKITDYLVAIRAGEFATNPSPFRCPGCPAFFICGPTPAGVLTKKF